jgi:hypothetical protein
MMGLRPAAARRTVELDETECVGEVGDRKRGHFVGACGGDAVVDAHGAVDDREFAVQAQVNEAGRGHERNRKGARILLRSSRGDGFFDASIPRRPPPWPRSSQQRWS